MSETSEFFSTLKNVRDDDPIITKKIEAVLLHVRAREMETQKRKHIVFSVLMSLIMTLFMEIVKLIIYPFTDIMKFIFCVFSAVVGFILSEQIMLSTVQATIYAYLFAYVVFEIKGTTNLLRQFIFDTADIISFGSVTKLFSKIIVNGKTDACEIMLAENNKWYSSTPIAYHFYITRHPFHRLPKLADIENRFLDFSTNAADEKIVLTACDEYLQDFDISKT